ncbi:MAG: glucose-1-phosphate thymidylyltransferase [Dethiobacter sp.]|jgi:glucose-1-phosphate thymidylyltransferase|nr:MAG: glucose-1-phosphate thymidylyltransferase [Dethiobacter sp.]
MIKGLILCGGSGSRLLPFTFSLPKQLIPVANKPVLCYIMEAFKKAGIEEIGIIVGDKEEIIREKLKDPAPAGLNLTYIKQAKPLGLAHAVQTAQPFLKDSDFIMILGDNLFGQSLEEALSIFGEQEADALVFLTPVDDPRRYGIAEVENGQVISLREKPLVPRSNLAIMGIYIFRKNIFAAIERIVPSWRGELEITDALQELINMGGKVLSYMFPGWWMDIGKPEDVLEANRKILNLLTAPENSFGNARVVAPLCLAAPSAFIEGSKLKGPLIIGEGCRITGSEIGPYSSIGPGSILEDAILENSVLFERVKIQGLKDPIRDSIIGQDAIILRGQEKKSKSFLLGAGSLLSI